MLLMKKKMMMNFIVTMIQIITKNQFVFMKNILHKGEQLMYIMKGKR